MKKDLVSIIIPCYNGQAFLDRLFCSLAQQTYKKQQIIFVNDGSMDETEKIALKYQEYLTSKGIQFIYLYQSNQGQATAINNAIPYMEGEYCMWFDADDYMSEDHIHKKVSFLKNHPDRDLVMCRGCIIDEVTNKKIQNLGYEKSVGTLFEDIIFEYRRCTPGLYMVRTEALLSSLKDGRIYETRAGQNFQLLLPVANRGNNGYLDEMLFYYVYRKKSHSRSFYTSSDFINRFNNLEDVRLRVIKELDINDDYKNKLIHHIKQFMMMQKINNLEKHILFKESNFIENVNKDFLRFSKLPQYLNNRELYLWGACPINDCIKKMLNQYSQFTVKGYIDSDKSKVSQKREGLTIYDIKVLDSKKIYIIIPLKMHNSILRKLQQKGFKNKKDFYYPEYELRKFLENQYANF